jgi:sigma-B regulation protein RsbU (phosphoserine phosphatase)
MATLLPGGMIVIYTDGVTEAADVQGRPFGEQGLAERLAGLDCSSAQEACASVVETVMAYTHPLQQQDDITLVCIRRLPRS